MDAIAVEAFQALDPENFYRKFVSQGVRPDGRSHLGQRPIHISTGVLTADHVVSSALVRMGGTKFVGAATLQIGIPADATPSCGDIEVSVTLPPLCSSQFSYGRASELSQSVETFVRETLIASAPVMREDLCIEVGVAAWRVCIDVMCISYDGNAADAALVCAVTCLRHLKLPSTSEVDGLRFIEDGEGTTLPLQALPLPLTLGIFDDAIIADPTLMEEELLATQVTIAQTPDGRVCAIHKPGGVCMGNETMVKCLALSMEHSRRLAPIVDNATPPASA